MRLNLDETWVSYHGADHVTFFFCDSSQMIHQNSMRFLHNVAYDESYGLAFVEDENAECDRIGQTLGDKVSRHDTTRHDTTRHDMTRNDTTRRDVTRRDPTRHDTTRHNTT